MRQRLAERPIIRSVSLSSEPELLAGFSCGGKEVYERDVNDKLAELLDNRESNAAEEVELRVAETGAERDLIGLSIHFENPLPQLPEYAVCMALVAVRDTYRGVRMPDGGRIGDFLLCDALDQIAHTWGNPMSAMWAAAHRDNAPSKRLLRMHGFSGMRSDGDYPIYLRNKGCPCDHGFSPDMLEAVKLAALH